MGRDVDAATYASAFVLFHCYGDEEGGPSFYRHFRVRVFLTGVYSSVYVTRDGKGGRQLRFISS